MTWGLFPLLSFCLLIRVKHFSGKTVPKDVAVNHGMKRLEQSSPFVITQKQASKLFLLNFNDHTNFT